MKNIIIKDIIKNGNAVSVKLKESYFKKKYPSIYSKIIKDIKYDCKFSEKLYIFLYCTDNIKPKCECNKDLNFKSFTKGYSKYCSYKCLNQSINKKELVKKTCIKKYGVDNPFKSKDVKEKIIDTFIKKYGTSNPNKLEEIKEKTRKTNIKKYGVDYHLKLKSTQKKIKSACIKKYGVDNISKSEHFKSKLAEIKLNRLKSQDIIKYDDVKNELTVKCELCEKNYNINYNLFKVRLRNGNIKCTNCNPINLKISSKEIEIFNYLKSLNLNLEKANRSIIKPLELDIYIPEKKVAIELNGLYWHSELFKAKDYHLNKTILCQEKGIQLIHIFEDEWLYKQDIVKSRLKNILGLTNSKIYARKTEVRGVSSKEARKFLEENHIQGFVKSKIKLGLYHNGDLVSLMTFGSLRKSMGSIAKEGSYEMLRFCNKLDTNVVGGASKLFKHFIKEHKPIKVISYADRRWSNGNLYRQLGFNELEPSKPGYSYIINCIRDYRYKYRKSELIKEGFNKNKSEHDIMLERGIYRIYDCGNLKFEYQ